MGAWRAGYAGLLPAAFLDELDVAKREDEWRQWLLRPDRWVVVAVAAGSVQAFCMWSDTRDPVPRGVEAEIVAIYVHPRVWRNGHGQRLTRRVRDDARARGFQALMLWVLEQNAHARAFYEAMGFFPDGALKSEVIGGTRVNERRYRVGLDC